jgi:hypothetical protein
MARSIGLQLPGGIPAARREPHGLLRSLLAGAVLLAAWLAIWTFLVLGVAAPLGALQGPAPRPAASERA